MAVFKVARCRSCGYRRNEPKPRKGPGPCSKCGGEVVYSENWHISYTHQGRKRVESVGSQKRMAEDKLGKVRTAIRERRHFDMAPATTWSRAVEQFTRWFKTNKKPHTQRMYRNSLRNLEPHFGDLTLDKITGGMVEEYKALRALEVTNSTVNRDLATLKRLMSLAKSWGLVEVNRVRDVELLPENKARLRYLTEDEIGRLFKACDDPSLEYHPKRKEWVKAKTPGRKLPHLRLAIQIALHTGLRKEGVLTLKWSEVDFDRDLITKEVKGGVTVHIPLTATLRAALLEYRAASKVVSTYVLPSPRKGGVPVDPKKGFYAALRRGRIDDFRFHDLRHTFATLFLRRTKDLYALKEILGHSDIKMTMRYAHILDEHKREAMEVFDRAQVTGQSAALRTEEG